MILGNIPAGKVVLYQGTTSEACRKLSIHLSSLGFVKESQVTIISNGGYGPVIVGLSNRRVALGRNMANKIIVTEPPEQNEEK